MLGGDRASQLTRASPERLADETIEAYLCWRDACEAVERSYADWSLAARSERWLGYAAHVAAVDREERAALTYREAVERGRARSADGAS